MGTSAGAMHAASYISHPEFHAGGIGIAGGILLSGFYDLTTVTRDQLLTVYYGDDPSRYAARSSIEGLVETRLPWMTVLTEFDPPDFERQALALVNRYYQRHQRWPQFIRLMGHNHYTSTMHLNTADDYLGTRILDFIGRA
jgi:triacylglycerol lipase